MNESLINRSALGALSGFAGTLALQGLRTASQRWLPETMAPLREEPGAFVVEQIEEALPEKAGRRVPAAAEAAAANALAVGYGLAFGAFYGLVRPRTGNVWVEGTALGLGVWAAGYLGWIPALELMPPVTKQRPAEVVAPALRHALFGVVTAAVYRWLDDALS